MERMHQSVISQITVTKTREELKEKEKKVLLDPDLLPVDERISSPLRLQMLNYLPWTTVAVKAVIIGFTGLTLGCDLRQDL